MIAQPKIKRNIWSVIEKSGSYVAQVTEANSQAKMDGWRVVATGLTVSEACEQRDSLKHSNGIAADLSDLLMWDYAITEDDTIDTYDTIFVQCNDGIYRTGVVLDWNATNVYIEVGTITYTADKETAELICKIDEDYEFGADYEQWLDEIEVSQTGELVA